MEVEMQTMKVLSISLMMLATVAFPVYVSGAVLRPGKIMSDTLAGSRYSPDR